MNNSPNFLPESQSLLFCWGKNKDGELSLGHCKAVTLPKPVKGLKNSSPIRLLSSGRQHTAFISSDGVLSICGSALHGKLGLEDLTMTCITKLQALPFLKSQRVLDVACGDYHTLCLLETGEVYAWGGTLHKKLGQKSGRPAIIPSLSNKKIISVSCGDFHSAALSQNGELFTWGGGGSYFNRGQLGHGHLKDLETPEIISFFKQGVKKISCGGYHTLALTMNDEVYGWGSGTYGECGFGEFVDSSAPRLVKIEFEQKGLVFPSVKPRVIDLMAGGHHSLILTSQGYVYSFGYGSHGQLGLKSTINECEPKLIYSLTNKHVIQIAVGWNHSLVLTESFDLYATGYGSSGQLGLGNDESKTEFTWVSSMAGKCIKRIFAGGNHSWVLLDENNPMISNYKPPSPLRESEKIDDLGTFENKSLNLGPVSKKIELHYCELEMLHRFVRFELYDIMENKQEIQKMIEDFSKEMEVLDEGFSLLRLCKFQEDQEIIMEMNGEIMNHSGGEGKKWTLMMVCEPKIRLQGFENQKFIDLEETSIGEKRLLSFQEIQDSDSQEKAGFNWILLFEQRFKAYCKEITFFELRPGFKP